MAELATADAVQSLLAGQILTGDKATRVNDLIEVVGRLIEAETGRTYIGAAPVRTLTVYYDGFGDLVLPRRIFTITSVVKDPTWDGTGWSGGSSISSSAILKKDPDSFNAFSRLEHLTDRWRGFYAVTGTWETHLSAPGADLVYAANYLVSEILKNQQADPAGVMGPEGLVTSVRNAFREPEIAAILSKYRIAGHTPLVHA